MLFFLTGYLVMNSWQNRKSTKEYWKKRIARTLPIYYFFVLLFVLFRLDWMLKRCLVHTQSTFNAAILGTTNSIV